MLLELLDSLLDVVSWGSCVLVLFPSLSFCILCRLSRVRSSRSGSSWRSPLVPPPRCRLLMHQHQIPTGLALPLEVELSSTHAQWTGLSFDLRVQPLFLAEDLLHVFLVLILLDLRSLDVLLQLLQLHLELLDFLFGLLGVLPQLVDLFVPCRDHVLLLLEFFLCLLEGSRDFLHLRLEVLDLLPLAVHFLPVRLLRSLQVRNFAFGRLDLNFFLLQVLYSLLNFLLQLLLLLCVLLKVLSSLLQHFVGISGDFFFPIPDGLNDSLCVSLLLDRLSELCLHPRQVLFHLVDVLTPVSHVVPEFILQRPDHHAGRLKLSPQIPEFPLLRPEVVGGELVLNLSDF
mmetsp:Transcript_23175/g.45612  ORF Transcript_23175/g.45612 Transcript_23175/m.45612 type:complete len:343 (-) Transcript_23175:1207-2235(-)